MNCPSNPPHQWLDNDSTSQKGHRIIRNNQSNTSSTSIPRRTIEVSLITMLHPFSRLSMDGWINTVGTACLNEHQHQQLQSQSFFQTSSSTFTTNQEPSQPIPRCISQPSSPSSSPPPSQPQPHSHSANKAPTTSAVPLVTWLQRVHIKLVILLVISVCQPIISSPPLHHSITSSTSPQFCSSNTNQ